jgi:hypothetical protein
MNKKGGSNMDIEITLKNYRCFSDSDPARFIIQNRFIAFIGVNNSGKSSLLKFFYEFRDLFNRFMNSGSVMSALVAEEHALNFPNSVRDTDEVFCNLNNRNIFIEIKFRSPMPMGVGIPRIKKIIVEVKRDTKSWMAKIESKDGVIQFGRKTKVLNTALYENEIPLVDLYDLMDVGKILSRMIYIGPYRNVINAGSSNEYFDISVGEAFVLLWRSYKTGYQKNRNEIAYGVIDDIKRIFSFESLDINPSEDGNTLQVFINRKS